MHLKTLGIEEHNSPKWAVQFHQEFLPDFKRFSEAVRREVYTQMSC